MKEAWNIAESVIVLMRDEAREAGAYLHGFPNAILRDIHFNILGHKVASTVIAGRICEAALKG